MFIPSPVAHCEDSPAASSFQPATIQERLKFIGLSDEDLALQPEENKINRIDLGNGKEVVSDSAGGCVIVEK